METQVHVFLTGRPLVSCMYMGHASFLTITTVFGQPRVYGLYFYKFSIEYSFLLKAAFVRFLSG